MARFVELTLDSSNEKVFVHADSIIKFWRRPGLNYTVVDLNNGTSITVQETTDDIWNETMD